MLSRLGAVRGILGKRGREAVLRAASAPASMHDGGGEVDDVHASGSGVGAGAGAGLGSRGDRRRARISDVEAHASVLEAASVGNPDAEAGARGMGVRGEGRDVAGPSQSRRRRLVSSGRAMPSDKPLKLRYPCLLSSSAEGMVAAPFLNSDAFVAAHVPGDMWAHSKAIVLFRAAATRARFEALQQMR